MAQLPPARAAALDCLSACLIEGRDLQAALDTALTSDPLSDRDAGLVTELVYGYCRLKGRLDALLARFLDPSRRLPDEAMLALGLAAHEIIHLDRVPAYASVNWAVDWAKGYTRAHLSGLFNAVLRRVCDMAEAARTLAPYKEGAKDEAEVLSRYYSCPEWIVRLWLKEYPKEEVARYLKAQARPPAMGLAVEAESLGTEPAMALSRRLGAHPACLGRQGLGLAFQPGTGLDTLAEDLALTDEERAALYRQGFSARQALAALNPQRWPTPVWDACSGRGGKTRLLIEAGCAPVLASDTHLGRLRALKRELAPAVESGRLLAFRARADMPSPLSTPPGSILLDAPCTGLGTLSRRPDIKWKRQPSDVLALARIQSDMLENCFAALASGGQLFYLTCTLSPEENQRQVARFLDSHPAARLAGSWTTPPDVAAGEFFYAASLQKVGE
ncbi:MAG: transcription antitermination factor NusB [Humidesulfovibrio sp.]|uniref:transcription antitermination factor NusB n=1 Tax=Humidesulfovibrio sp. TaxID=2910988 RepID=UPI002732CFA3|nr:transcription antitermination factor NusB [Humidesulfovibrio sp.]MDP2847557.1 transcription antitermination factor NusB [Humidesulfovibrio sp.]